MNKLMLACFFSILYFSLTAQVNFEKAILTLKWGEPINGYVERMGNIDLSKGITFQETETSSPKEYSPDQIQRLELSSEKTVYESIEINSAYDTTKKVRLAQKLMEGELELFKLELPEEEKQIIRKLRNSFAYYLRKDGSFHRLELVEKYLDVNRGSAGSTKSYVLFEEYIGVLKFLFKDCPKVVSKVDELKFKDKNITQLIQDYASCKGISTQVIETEKVKNKKVDHWVSASYITRYSSEVDLFSTDGFGLGYTREVTNFNRSTRLRYLIGLNLVYLFEEREISGPTSDISNFDDGFFLTLPIGILIPFSRSAKVSPFFSLGVSPTVATPSSFEDVEFFLSLDTSLGVKYDQFKFTVSYRDFDPSIVFGIFEDFIFASFVFFEVGYAF